MVATNNELSTFVNVLSGGLNVLYIEGALRVETKFLRRALDSSPDIKVDYVRLDADDPQSRPADFADRFRPGKYNVYILGDVDSTAFLGRRADPAGPVRQPRGGPDHARRLSDVRSRRLRRDAAGEGAAGGHGPVRAAAAQRAACAPICSGPARSACGPRRWACGTSP